MKFYMPVKVFDEQECVKIHAKELCSFGKKALVVTGKRSAFSNGSFDDVAEALKSSGTDFEVFSDVEENPSTETVFAARDRFVSEGIDYVIGIGGGSPMDAAKAIALVLAHPEYSVDDLYDVAKDPSALPVVCIPTTCGTGSEVTAVSVLTRHDKKTKISMVHKVFPALALIDGKYIRNASLSLMANSSIDALSHLLESVLSARADAYVRMTALFGLREWSKTRDIITGEREASDIDRAFLMRSSAFAGMSIAQSGTSLPHALSYPLTYDLGLAHGRAVGFFLPGFLAAAPDLDRDELLFAAGFSGLPEFSMFIHKALGEIAVSEEELNRSFEAVKSNASKMKSASFPVDEKVLGRIVFDTKW